ncbi:hypothetical protein HDU86_008081 [Geranomyces michiganensis]|nr:hypothetical protein HDU86_008081 [Geranomyces michiganensis]
MRFLLAASGFGALLVVAVVAYEYVKAHQHEWFESAHSAGGSGSSSNTARGRSAEESPFVRRAREQAENRQRQQEKAEKEQEEKARKEREEQAEKARKEREKQAERAAEPLVVEEDQDHSETLLRRRRPVKLSESDAEQSCDERAILLEQANAPAGSEDPDDLLMTNIDEVHSESSRAPQVLPLQEEVASLLLQMIQLDETYREQSRACHERLREINDRIQEQQENAENTAKSFPPPSVDMSGAHNQELQVPLLPLSLIDAHEVMTPLFPPLEDNDSDDNDHLTDCDDRQSEFSLDSSWSGVSLPSVRALD